MKTIDEQRIELLDTVCKAFTLNGYNDRETIISRSNGEQAEYMLLFPDKSPNWSCICKR